MTLEEIRARSATCHVGLPFPAECLQVEDDRAYLLVEVDRLTAIKSESEESMRLVASAVANMGQEVDRLRALLEAANDPTWPKP